MTSLYSAEPAGMLLGYYRSGGKLYGGVAFDKAVKIDGKNSEGMLSARVEASKEIFDDRGASKTARCICIPDIACILFLMLSCEVPFGCETYYVSNQGFRAIGCGWLRSCG